MTREVGFERGRSRFGVFLWLCVGAFALVGASILVAIGLATLWDSERDGPPRSQQAGRYVEKRAIDVERYEPGDGYVTVPIEEAMRVLVERNEKGKGNDRD